MHFFYEINESDPIFLKSYCICKPPLCRGTTFCTYFKIQPFLYIFILKDKEERSACVFFEKPVSFEKNNLFYFLSLFSIVFYLLQIKHTGFGTKIRLPVSVSKPVILSLLKITMLSDS